MGAGEPKVTQVETMSPEQKRFLNTMLDFFPQAMMGQTIGEPWGGPGQESYSPFTIGEGKGGGAPRGERPRGKRPGDRSGGRESPLDAILTGPIVEPFRRGQTGNYPRGRR